MPLLPVYGISAFFKKQIKNKTQKIKYPKQKIG
jgi:hypothetical protein